MAPGRSLGARCRLGVMGEWWSQNAVSAIAILISIVSLLGTILYRRRRERKGEFELLLQRIDREAARREATINQEATKRDERFEREAAKREAALDQEAAKREATINQEAAKRDERFEREAAKREAETRAFTERLDREAAERDERFEREAAKRDERFEREVAKREEAIQALMDRSDRKFEVLLARSDELSRQLTQLIERVVTNEASLDEVRAAVLRMAPNPASSPGRGEALAAQEVPDNRQSD